MHFWLIIVEVILSIIIIANLYRAFEIYENIQRLHNSQTRYVMCYR